MELTEETSAKHKENRLQSPDCMTEPKLCLFLVYDVMQSLDSFLWNS